MNLDALVGLALIAFGTWLVWDSSRRLPPELRPLGPALRDLVGAAVGAALFVVLLVVSAPLALLGNVLVAVGERLHRFAVWLVEEPAP